MTDEGAKSRDRGGITAAATLRGLYGKADEARQADRYGRLASSLKSRSEAAISAGDARFYSAPGRVELGGNHTDHNRGKVLCAAVDLDTAACAVPNGSVVVRLWSEGFDPVVVDLGSLDPVPSERGTTAALVRGIAWGLAERGVAPRGFDCATHSSVPPGSGLSSSAAIEVLIATIMADFAGTAIPPLEIARIGQRAENDWFGKPCGLMDQAASAAGGISYLDFADPESPAYRRIDFDFARRGLRLAIVNTGGSHADLTAEYASIPAEMRAVANFLGAAFMREVDPAALVARGPEIRKACGDRALLRAFHFAAENERVDEMADALDSGDLKAFLKLTRKSGRSSWQLLQNLYPASVPAEQGIPLALELSSMCIGKNGAWRVNGGGFAGTIESFVPESLWDEYSALMERYFGRGAVIAASIRGNGATRVSV